MNTKLHPEVLVEVQAQWHLLESQPLNKRRKEYWPRRLASAFLDLVGRGHLQSTDKSLKTPLSLYRWIGGVHRLVPQNVKQGLLRRWRLVHWDEIDDPA